MTTTPLTDAQVAYRHGHPTEDLVLAKFARKLERKLRAMTTAKNRAVDELRKAELTPCYSCEEQMPCEATRWSHKSAIYGTLKCRAATSRLKLIAELEKVSGR